MALLRTAETKDEEQPQQTVAATKLEVKQVSYSVGRGRRRKQILHEVKRGGAFP